MITNCFVHKVILLNHASVGLPLAAAFANFVFMQSLSGLRASSKLSLTQTTEPLDKLQTLGAARRSDFRRTNEGVLYCTIPVFLVLSHVLQKAIIHLSRNCLGNIVSCEIICIFLAPLQLISSYSFTGK
jgi:hypothetical protein